MSKSKKKVSKKVIYSFLAFMSLNGSEKYSARSFDMPSRDNICSRENKPSNDKSPPNLDMDSSKNTPSNLQYANPEKDLPSKKLLNKIERILEAKGILNEVYEAFNAAQKGNTWPLKICLVQFGTYNYALDTRDSGLIDLLNKLEESFNANSTASSSDPNLFETSIEKPTIEELYKQKNQMLDEIERILEGKGILDKAKILNFDAVQKGNIELFEKALQKLNMYDPSLTDAIRKLKWVLNQINMHKYEIYNLIKEYKKEPKRSTLDKINAYRGYYLRAKEYPSEEKSYSNKMIPSLNIDPIKLPSEAFSSTNTNTSPKREEEFKKSMKKYTDPEQKDEFKKSMQESLLKIKKNRLSK